MDLSKFTRAFCSLPPLATKLIALVGMVLRLVLSASIILSHVPVVVVMLSRCGDVVDDPPPPPVVVDGCCINVDDDNDVDGIRASTSRPCES